MLPSKKLLCLKPNFYKQLTLVAFYSRKSDSKNLGYYKIVKSNDVIDDTVDKRLGAITNWELFAPKGYRFVLPGSLGPAWHEAGSMVPIDNFQRLNSKANKIDLEELECMAQECPILLRKGLYTCMSHHELLCLDSLLGGLNLSSIEAVTCSHQSKLLCEKKMSIILGVLELFPNIEIYASQQLTVVTLSHVKSLNKKQNLDADPEYYAKTFIWAAQEICLKLKATGYWADFINPFSGRPYITPYHKPTLYETDERFRCLGFEIRKKGNCKVIEFQKDKLFVGSLFTNAPPNTEVLYDILSFE